MARFLKVSQALAKKFKLNHLAAEVFRPTAVEYQLESSRQNLRFAVQRRIGRACCRISAAV